MEDFGAGVPAGSSRLGRSLSLGPLPKSLEVVCRGVRGGRGCERNHKSVSSRACMKERKRIGKTYPGKETCGFNPKKAELGPWWPVISSTTRGAAVWGLLFVRQVLHHEALDFVFK